MNKSYINPEKVRAIVAAVMLLFMFGVGIGVRVNESLNTADSTEVVETLPVIFTEATEPVGTTVTEEIEIATKPATETIRVESPILDEMPHIETEPVETSSEAVSAPDTDEIDPGTGMSDLEMLACVIYQEVGGDMHCDDCRYRVADVVLNRVAHEEFPDTIYDVLMAEGQYGMFYWTGIQWADRASNPNEANAVARAWETAENVLAGQHSELYGEGYIWQAGHEQGTDGFWCCGHFFGR